MLGKIIWYVTMFACFLLFYGIGVFSQRRKKPMWFWSGTEVTEISDIPQYNRENARMWKLHSLWYLAAGVARIWSITVAMLFLGLGCTLGIWILVTTYSGIYWKYKKE